LKAQFKKSQLLSKKKKSQLNIWFGFLG